MTVLAFCLAVGLVIAASGKDVSAAPIYVDSAVASDVIDPWSVLAGTPNDGSAFPPNAFSEMLAAGDVGPPDIDTFQRHDVIRLSEPVSLLLLGVGLAAAAVVRRRRSA